MKPVLPHPIECENPTQATEAPELLPCPFCGGSNVTADWYAVSKKGVAILDEDGDRIEYVLCADCRIGGGASGVTRKKWNRRAAMQCPAPAGEVAALREALEAIKVVQDTWRERSGPFPSFSELVFGGEIVTAVDAVEALATAPVTPAAEADEWENGHYKIQPLGNGRASVVTPSGKILEWNLGVAGPIAFTRRDAAPADVEGWRERLKTTPLISRGRVDLIKTKPQHSSTPSSPTQPHAKRRCSMDKFLLYIRLWWAGHLPRSITEGFSDDI